VPAPSNKCISCRSNLYSHSCRDIAVPYLLFHANHLHLKTYIYMHNYTHYTNEASNSPLKPLIQINNPNDKNKNRSISKLMIKIKIDRFFILFTTRKPEKSNGITEGIFSSVIYTDGNNSVSKSVGIYRRIYSVGNSIGIY
jgi:hypothetical protein